MDASASSAVSAVFASLSGDTASLIAQLLIPAGGLLMTPIIARMMISKFLQISDLKTTINYNNQTLGQIQANHQAISNPNLAAFDMQVNNNNWEGAHKVYLDTKNSPDYKTQMYSTSMRNTLKYAFPSQFEAQYPARFTQARISAGVRGF